MQHSTYCSPLTPTDARAHLQCRSSELPHDLGTLPINATGMCPPKLGSHFACVYIQPSQVSQPASQCSEPVRATEGEDQDGACCLVAAAVGSAASPGPGRGGARCPRAAPGAVLLRVRGLAGGQREQQRHRVAGAGELPALRRRLSRRADGAVQQRPHHRRRRLSASGLRRLHPRVRRRKQRSARHRRQLRLCRSRNPGRDWPAIGRPDKLRRAAPELPVGGAAAGEHPGRRGLGGEPPEPVHLHRRHGQQRLPQQLFHARLLQHRPAVHPGAVRRRPHRPVFPADQGLVQQRGEEGGADRRGAGWVQPERAGAAEPQRRDLRRADQRRHPDLQPEADRPRRPVQHVAGGALHLHQRLRDLRGHPQSPRIKRPDGDEPRVLRGGEEQRAGDVPAVPDAVRQPERVPLLGRLPPDGGGQRARRAEDVQRRAAVRRPPGGPTHARAALTCRKTIASGLS